MNTPVVFLVYKRLDVTRHSFESIRNAQPKKLFIVADGPKNNAEAKKTSSVIRFLKRAINWDCEVMWNVSKFNLGLAERVSSGISWAFNFCDQAIIIEDDCIPGPSFYKFCEELLVRYEYENRIGCITGDNFQDGKHRGKGSYYFSDFPHCWGWATWKRAWSEYDHELSNWNKILQVIKKRFDLISYKYWITIKDKLDNGDVDSWAYRWTFSLWSKRLLTITPNVNLVKNIGFGTKATHSKSLEYQYPRHSIGFPLNHPSVIRKNSTADNYTLKNYFKTQKKLSVNRFSAEDFININNKKGLGCYKTEFIKKELSYYNPLSLLSQNKEIFENEIYKFRSNKKDPIIYDIGADIGLSLIYFKRIFPLSKIIAIEHDKSRLKFLQHNVYSFGMKNVDLQNYLIPKGENCLLTSNNLFNNLDTKIKVSQIELKGLNPGSIDYLKVSSRENINLIIKDNPDFIKNTKLIFLEYSYKKNNTKELTNIINYLSEYNFDCEINQRVVPEKEKLKDSEIKVNISCTNKSNQH